MPEILLSALGMALMLLSPVAQQQAADVAPAPVHWADAGEDLLVPDEIKPTGEHGTVVLEGDITADAHIANLVIAKSSGSDKIDAYARGRYAKARLGSDLVAGQPSRVWLTVNIYNTEGMDFGANLSCPQAVLDADWYAKANPGKGVEHTPLYRLIESGGTLLGNKTLAFAQDRANYDRIWTAAIETCRSAPTERFFPVLIAESKKRTG